MPGSTLLWFLAHWQVATEPYDAANVTAQMNAFPEPNKSLIFWLLDMMADIVQNEALNKMSTKNMAIVLSPNLYQTSDDSMANPMAALTMAQKVQEPR